MEWPSAKGLLERCNEQSFQVPIKWWALVNLFVCYVSPRPFDKDIVEGPERFGHLALSIQFQYRSVS